MKTYEFTIKHDSGTVTVRTSATDISAAQEIVCASECCPRSALSSWRIVPTARQIAKTKNLLRSL